MFARRSGEEGTARSVIRWRRGTGARRTTAGRRRAKTKTTRRDADRLSRDGNHGRGAGAGSGRPRYRRGIIMYVITPRNRFSLLCITSSYKM